VHEEYGKSASSWTRKCSIKWKTIPSFLSKDSAREVSGWDDNEANEMR